jgi:valacyclovir hydrolase
MPGAMGTAETDFSYQLDGLSQSHGVVSLDPRGYGKSRPPNRRYPVDFYHKDADDAAKVMEKLGCDAYHVIGWSDGAISATLLAAKYPQLVQKLVVFGIQATITKEDVDMYEGMRDFEKAWSKRMLETHRAVYGDDVQPMWSSFCDAMKMIYDAGGDFCQAQATTLKCPTLILHGEKDPIVPAHHPQWFHENIAGSQMYTFPGGKHNIHQKFADDFNARVLKFFAE